MRCGFEAGTPTLSQAGKEGKKGARATGKAHNPPTFTKFGTPLPTPLPTRGSPAADPATHLREPFAQCAPGEATTLVCGLLGRDIGERDRWPPRNASRSPARENSKNRLKQNKL